MNHPMKVKHKTREQWLNAAVVQLTKKFFKGDTKMPEQWAISCGFVKGGGDKGIGQCWSPESAEDGVTTHMFICPTRSEPIDVLGITIHEMIHAAIGIDEKHGKKFKQEMARIGLEGKATATKVPEEGELRDYLEGLSERLGPYPHSPLSTIKKVKKPNAGGWVRLVSPENEKYKVLISPKQLDECGPPLDPWGNVMEEIEIG